MNKSTTKIAIIIILMITAVVGYYAYLSNKKHELKEEAAMTVVESTLSRDLNIDYPSTPKEVLKYYNQIVRCFYNEECTDEEVEKLGLKARELYDTELLEANEVGAYMLRLKEDIEEYKKAKRQINGFSVSASTDVIYDTVNGYECAKLYCSYNVKEGNSNIPSKEVYLLRKDENKRWKIYGWKQLDDREDGEDHEG